MTGKTTGSKAASSASKTMSDGRTSEDSKSAAGSALSQTNSGKTTGDDAASSASGVMSSDSTGKHSKTAAASALSQTENGKKK